jgi:hypothetical protein
MKSRSNDFNRSGEGSVTPHLPITCGKKMSKLSICERFALAYTQFRFFPFPKGRGQWDGRDDSNRMLSLRRNLVDLIRYYHVVRSSKIYLYEEI